MYIGFDAYTYTLNLLDCYGGYCYSNDNCDFPNGFGIGGVGLKSDCVGEPSDFQENLDM